MVVLNKIYTRTGDGGTTRLATGEEVKKHDARVSAYGDADELNSAIGVALIALAAEPALAPVLADLQRIQNELFDLGADLATPHQDPPPAWTPLRMVASQVSALEAAIDRLNADLAPLNSFILPGGSAASAHLHLARTIARRAERSATLLAESALINPEAIKYLNRVSDYLFVAARWTNFALGIGDVLWRPGATR